MSYGGLLQHKCNLLTLTTTFADGMPVSAWTPYATGVKCFLDLNFIRRGKDPMWTPEAGRSSDRAGVLFLSGKANPKSGMRVQMTKGPSGTFLVEGAVDEAWRPTKLHHYELGVTEVPSQITKGQGTK